MALRKEPRNLEDFCLCLLKWYLSLTKMVKGIYYVNMLKTNNMAKKYSLSKRDFDTHKAKLQKFFKEINLLPCAFATCHYSFHGSRNNLQLTRCTTTVKKNGTTKRESQNRHSFSQYIVQGVEKSPIWSSGKSIFSYSATFKAHLLDL